MMTDIVWLLRNDCPCNGDIGCAQELCNQAADEIERLRVEIAAARDFGGGYYAACVEEGTRDFYRRKVLADLARAELEGLT
jgi:hypothetical protein